MANTVTEKKVEIVASSTVPKRGRPSGTKPVPLILSTNVPVELRAYISELAANSSLFPTQLQSDFYAFSLHAFLLKRPWEDKKTWHWVNPELYYHVINGKRVSRQDIVPINAAIEDLKDGRKAKELVAEFKKVAADLTPKTRAFDTGISTATLSWLTWATTKLFPPSKYRQRLSLPSLV